MAVVFEFEEIVYAEVRFLTETNAELDHSTLKDYFFQNLCGLPRVNHTINVVVDQMMVREDGEDIGRLAILDNQEPADIVYEWQKLMT